LREVAERETATHAAELERRIARARADSMSLLVEQERELGEVRRREIADREAQARTTLARALSDAQKVMEQRLAEWGEDLDRAQQTLVVQLDRLGERQRQLIAEAEARIAADAEGLKSESEQQRAALVSLREDVTAATRRAVESAAVELDAVSAERKHALAELEERLVRREHAIAQTIEREEAETARRIHARFADIARRQVEQLERLTARSVSSYSEAAGQQFDDAIRRAREDAAQRLARELDRAVQNFLREAQSVLAEQLSHVGDAGAQRLETRLARVAAALDRQRDEYVATVDQRLAHLDEEVRRRTDAIAADADAHRAVLEARLHELARRIDAAVNRARDELESLRTS
jgi:hypothetical protein